MVNVRNTLNHSIHNVISPRILPKTTSRTAAGTTPGASPTTIPATTSAPSDPAADFRALFTNGSKPPTPSVPAPATAQPAVPTAQSVFGANPWISNPGGVAPNGVTYGYNPTYFATRGTADKLAQMYGGTVVETNAITPFGPFQQNQMNEMIKFPNGNVVNAGILASYFDRGFTQDQINQAISKEITDIPG